MIPNEEIAKSEHIGDVKHVANFNVTNETLPRILVSLSDKMYTKKELAVIREYSTNAVDAMTKAGKPISEIEVHLPTLDDMNFRIRDYGSGLSFEEIQNIYCVMGESDKRNSNEYNGMFGYGCKSGFAHADTFTVTSWYGGEMTIYQCIKGDTTKLHHVVELARCPSDAPSGIQVEVPVLSDSMWTFQTEGINLYKYWETLPTFTGLDNDKKEIMDRFRDTEATLTGDAWEIRPTANVPSGRVYMGYVTYRIDWDVVDSKLAIDQKSRALFNIIKRNNVILHASIGDVSFVNSREELEYTPETIEFLVAKMKDIFECIQDSIQSKFEGIETLWEAKKVYNSIFGTGELVLERGESHEDLEKIRILQGNWMELEQTFKDTFHWNNIILGSPYFDNINRFDNYTNKMDESNGFNPSDPVMVTFRKKKASVRRRKCASTYHNCILASNAVAVVINDTKSNVRMQAAARYLVFGKADSKIKAVHILSFDTDELKQKFYDEYSFDTVPVILASEIMEDVKAWMKSSRPSSGKGFGGGGGVRVMKYCDINSGDVLTTSVPVREMEDGGVFLRIGDGRNNIIGSDNYSRNLNDTAIYLKKMSEGLDMEFDRVYIINNQTGNAKWFKEEVDSGAWRPLWEVLDEELEDVDWEKLTILDAYDKHSGISINNTNHLVDKITDKDSPMLAMLKSVDTNKSKENIRFINALRELQLWNKYTKDIKIPNFNSMSTELWKRYPLLTEIYGLSGVGYGLGSKLNKVAQYINAMDMFFFLTPEELPENEKKELDKAA